MWSSHSQYLLIPSLGASTVPSTSPALSPHNPTEEPLWRVPCKRGGRRKQQESDSAVLPPVIHPSAACQPVVSLCLQHFSLWVSHFFLLSSGSLLPLSLPHPFLPSHPLVTPFLAPPVFLSSSPNLSVLSPPPSPDNVTKYWRKKGLKTNFRE